MKTALTNLFKKVKSIPDQEFLELGKIAGQIQITQTMMIDVFEAKKGIKIKETLEKMPRQDKMVLDSICDLFDQFGEEKQLTFQ